MRLPLKEFMQMEAERLFNGRVLFMVSEGGFFLLGAFLGEPIHELRKKEEEFPPRVGVTLKEAESLHDEFFLIRYGVLGFQRDRDPRTGELWGPTEVRSTGTAWDRLPKMEAEVMPDGRVALTLARGELGIFANCVEVAIEELVPTGSVVEREDFKSLKGMTIEEAEELRDELLRLDRETRLKSHR
jgi:hypothetical protein